MTVATESASPHTTGALRRPDEGAGLSRSRPACLGGRCRGRRSRTPTTPIVRITTSTICGTDLHILKGDVPSVTDGRILGHEGIGIVEEVGAGVSSFHAGRPGPHLLHHLVRQVRLLQEGHVLALPRRRLDPRQHHRRHAGGVRPHPARRHEPLPAPRGRRRRGARHAQRHPADRLRVRRAERPGQAGRHRRDRRRRPDRPRRAADGAVLFAGGSHHDRPGRQPPAGRQGVRRDDADQQRGRQGGRARDGPRPAAPASTSRSRRSAFPATFDICQSSWRRADASPTSASTASR